MRKKFDRAAAQNDNVLDGGNPIQQHLVLGVLVLEKLLHEFRVDKLGIRNRHPQNFYPVGTSTVDHPQRSMSPID